MVHPQLLTNHQSWFLTNGNFYQNKVHSCQKHLLKFQVPKIQTTVTKLPVPDSPACCTVSQLTGFEAKKSLFS